MFLGDSSFRALSRNDIASATVPGYRHVTSIWIGNGKTCLNWEGAIGVDSAEAGWESLGSQWKIHANHLDAFRSTRGPVVLHYNEAHVPSSNTAIVILLSSPISVVECPAATMLAGGQYQSLGCFVYKFCLDSLCEMLGLKPPGINLYHQCSRIILSPASASALQPAIPLLTSTHTLLAAPPFSSPSHPHDSFVFSQTPKPRNSTVTYCANYMSVQQRSRLRENRHIVQSSSPLQVRVGGWVGRTGDLVW